MENLRSKPFWDRSPLESLADGYKKLPRNFKLCMLATFIIGLAAHMYCYTNMLTGADDAFLFSDTRTLRSSRSGNKARAAPVTPAKQTEFQLLVTVNHQKGLLVSRHR